MKLSNTMVFVTLPKKTNYSERLFCAEQNACQSDNLAEVIIYSIFDLFSVEKNDKMCGLLCYKLTFKTTINVVC